MSSGLVPTVRVLGAAPSGKEWRGTAYADMDLQPSAKDCIRLRLGGREAEKGGGGKAGRQRGGTNRAHRGGRKIE